MGRIDFDKVYDLSHYDKPVNPIDWSNPFADAMHLNGFDIVPEEAYPNREYFDYSVSEILRPYSRNDKSVFEHSIDVWSKVCTELASCDAWTEYIAKLHDLPDKIPGLKELANNEQTSKQQLEVATRLGLADLIPNDSFHPSFRTELIEKLICYKVTEWTLKKFCEGKTTYTEVTELANEYEGDFLRSMLVQIGNDMVNIESPVHKNDQGCYWQFEEAELEQIENYYDKKVFNNFSHYLYILRRYRIDEIAEKVNNYQVSQMYPDEFKQYIQGNKVIWGEQANKAEYLREERKMLRRVLNLFKQGLEGAGAKILLLPEIEERLRKIEKKMTKSQSVDFKEAGNFLVQEGEIAIWYDQEKPAGSAVVKGIKSLKPKKRTIRSEGGQSIDITPVSPIVYHYWRSHGGQFPNARDAEYWPFYLQGDHLDENDEGVSGIPDAYRTRLAVSSLEELEQMEGYVIKLAQGHFESIGIPASIYVDRRGEHFIDDKHLKKAEFINIVIQFPGHLAFEIQIITAKGLMEYLYHEKYSHADYKHGVNGLEPVKNGSEHPARAAAIGRGAIFPPTR